MEKSASLSIKNWAEEDRPREKLLIKGTSALSDAELIGILLGSGTKTLTAVDLAKLILRESGNDLHKLAKLSVKDLMKFKGIGEAKAITIVSALELGRRRKDLGPPETIKVRDAEDAYEMLKGELVDLPHEEFWVILLKRNQEFIKKVKVSTGGVAATVVDSRMVFKAGVEALASAIILVHNHPSGSLKPSPEDLGITKKLIEGGKHLDVRILDHVIISDKGYFSFSENDMLV